MMLRGSSYYDEKYKLIAALSRLEIVSQVVVVELK